MKLPTNLSDITRHFSYGDHPRPERDWLIVLALLFVLLAVGVAWNVYFFTRITNEDDAAAAREAPRSLDLDALEKARAALNARAAERLRYEGEYGFVDPAR